MRAGLSHLHGSKYMSSSSSSLPASRLFASPSSLDDIVHNRGVLMELRRGLARAAAAYLVVGPSGCGKSALCRAAMSGASVLDVGTYSMQYQSGDVSMYAQKDPKQVMAAFATRKTLEQFMSPAPKAVFVDDVHVLAAKDRLLTSALAESLKQPHPGCTFVVTALPEHATRFSTALGIAPSAVLTMTSAPAKSMFRAVHDVLDRGGYVRDEATAADLLRICKKCDGNWHDLVASVDRRFCGPGPGAASSSAAGAGACIDDARYQRDIVACMNPTELAEHVLSRTGGFQTAKLLMDCDCAELVTLTYENWPSYLKTDAENAPKPRRTAAAMREGRARLTQAYCDVGDLYLHAAAMDARAMASTDWLLKDMSTLFRYGGLMHHMTELRRHALPAGAKRGMTRHLTKMSVAKKLPSVENPAAPQAWCDCAAATGELTPCTKPYATALQAGIF